MDMITWLAGIGKAKREKFFKVVKLLSQATGMPFQESAALVFERVYASEQYRSGEPLRRLRG